MSDFPPGWDESRVNRLIEHHESQTDEQAVAEDESAAADTTQVRMDIPVDLVPVVRALIAKRSKAG